MVQAFIEMLRESLLIWSVVRVRTVDGVDCTNHRTTQTELWISSVNISACAALDMNKFTTILAFTG